MIDVPAPSLPPGVDPASWLRTGPPAEVAAYLQEENRYTAAVLEHLAPLRRRLREELDQRVTQLIPPPTEREFASPDGAHVAALTLAGGDERSALRVGPNGSEPELSVPGATSFAWGGDRWLVYAVEGSARRPARVFRARREAGGWREELLLDEPDLRQSVRVRESRCGRLVFVVSEGRESTGAHVVRRGGDGTAPLQCLRARVPGVRFDVESDGAGFIYRTNDGASLRRVERCEPGTPAVTLVPEHAAAFLAKVLVFRSSLALLYREAGSDVLRLQPGPALSAESFGLSGPIELELDESSDFAGPEVSLEVRSPTTPTSRWAVDLQTGAARRVDALELRGFAPGSLRAQRLEALGADGVRIPVTVVRGSDARGPQPTVLFVYGAYGASLPASFSEARLSLLARGVTVAFAHVRGGGEGGPAWHAAGRRLRKWATFIDLISVAEHLVSAGLAEPGKLALWGVSAGGLAAAVASRLRPELLCGVVLEHPFVDVLGTMSDPTLPLTGLEYPEWGDPADPAVRKYMESYDPCLHTEGQLHPHVLVFTGMQDYRVPYWAPARWALDLRRRGRGPGRVLLRTELSGGHVPDAETSLERLALVHAFLLELFGKAHF